MSTTKPTIYTTFIERESCFVKIWAQSDKTISFFIENSLMQMKPQFDAGHGLLPIEQLHPGLLCCAKFKDDSYYRARVTNVTMLVQGMVEVLFIDYGNRDLIQVTNIRTIATFPNSVTSIAEQAKQFVLAKLQVNSTFPPDPVFEQISNELRYLDFEYQYVGQVGPYSLLSLSLGGQDIADSFAARHLGVSVDIPMQLMMLQKLISIPTAVVGPPAMPQHHQGMMAQRSPPIPSSPGVAISGQPSFLTYKSFPMKVATEHTVYVSYVTDGPCLFSVQLQHKELELQELMVELNKLSSLQPIEENILPGCVCLAKSSEDGYVCRAVVTNMVDENYKVFYVDFGNTEVRSFDQLFQIPFKYVIPKVMATRFALNGLQGQVVTVEMKVAFKNFVNNTLLQMRVCAPFPNTGIYLCDLWNADGVQAIDFVRGASLQAYAEPTPLNRGFNQEVKVGYVVGCTKFYVQLRKKEDELNKMMQDLQVAKMRPITQDLLKLNGPCIALYEADGMYYRAQILSIQQDSMLVKYVDYGNEENIPLKNIKAPLVEFITNLRPQAIECCLNGYQNMETDLERDNLLEEILLEQYFTMKVAEVLGNRILVDLFDGQMYNMASMLLDKLAKTRSQVSPPLVQDNRIEQRKPTTQRHNSPRDNNKTDSWRGQDRPQRTNSNDWRNKEKNTQNVDTNGDHENRRKTNSNTWSENYRNSADGEVSNSSYQDRRKPQNWGDRGDNQRQPREGSSGNRPERAPRSNEWGSGDNNKRTDTNWNESKRQNNYGGEHRTGSERESFSGDNKRNNFDNNRRGGSAGGRDANRFEQRDQRDFKKRTPRDDNFGGGQMNSPPRRPRRDNRSEEGSEKSFNSGKSFKSKRDNFSGSPPKKQVEDNVDYTELNEQFSVLQLIGTEQKASVSWFYNPTNFYLQLVADKVKFDTMMRDIQFAYKKRKPLDNADVGSIVIALFPEDKALYRAVVLEVPMYGTYKVQYVDFGNSGIANKIYKVERRFTELPIQAVQCGLPCVQPAGPQWPTADSFGTYFGDDLIDCKFEDINEAFYTVEIIKNGTSLKDQLQTAGLVKIQNLYEHFDINYLLSQQMQCKLRSVTALDDFTLEILPGLKVNCVIFKHEVATTPDLSLLRTFINQKIVAYVDDVQENKIYVTLYNAEGQFLPVIELQEEMIELVNPISAPLIIGPYLNGYVSHANETCVFVQEERIAKNVDLLLDTLFQCYETAPPEEFEVKEIIYAARSSDANWYRGLVTKIDGDDITVQFIDYGNDEVINRSALRLLKAEFCMPFLATEIKLADATKYLDQDIRLKVHFDEEYWLGEVEQTPTSTEPDVSSPQEIVEEVPEKLTVEDNTVQQNTPIVDALNEVESSLSPTGFSVVLSHLDNPGQFYLQQSSALDEIAQLQDQLQAQIDTLADIETVMAGIICAAQYSADQVWYRAQVLDADSDITTVRFIDYGNTDVLTNNIKIKSLPPDLLSLEEHAKRCSLNLSPTNGEWTTAAFTRFEGLVFEDDVPLTAEIVHQDEKTTFVRLYANNVCINDIFIQEGLATELQKPEAAFTGFVSNLNSPSEFWLQFEHACNDLEWIADQLVTADKFKLLEDQAPGSLCAAIFPEDQSWYRARILSNTVAGVEVLFIDYGNSCTCSSLRELPEDLVMVPALAHKCSLVKPQGLLEWSSTATDKFKEISADGVTVFTVIKHAQGETNQVQLLLNGQDVADILKPEMFDAKILSFKNFNEFAMRKPELDAKFVEVQSKIQELCEQPEDDETIVAALHENIFYRAKKNGAIVDKYLVDLLDLGIEADVTELRQLPKELVEIEPLAMSVKMNPLVGYAFNADSENYFKTLCESQDMFQVEVVSDKIVKLYLNGCDVRDKIPSTKCSPLSSVHSTPKKIKSEDVIDKQVSELKLTDEEDMEVQASPILLNKTKTEFDDTDVTMKTVEITDVNVIVAEATDAVEVPDEVKEKSDEITTKENEAICSFTEQEPETEMLEQVQQISIEDESKLSEQVEKAETTNIEPEHEEKQEETADTMIASVTEELVEKVVNQCIEKVHTNGETVVNGNDEDIVEEVLLSEEENVKDVVEVDIAKMEIKEEADLSNDNKGKPVEVKTVDSEEKGEDNVEPTDLKSIS